MSERPADRSGRIVLFGDQKRMRGILAHADRTARMRLADLWRLGPRDTILTCRPRTPVVEWLFIALSPQRRPRIVQVADGIVFPTNTDKRSNKRYGGLYRALLADGIVIQQDIADLAGIGAEPTWGLSTLRRLPATGSLPRRSLPLTPRPVVIVSGNDPFFDLDPGDVTGAFAGLMQRLHAVGWHDIRFSSPNATLTKGVRARLVVGDKAPDVIGPISQAVLDPSACLFIGSPSTVMFEQMLAGHPCFLISSYHDPVFRRYLAVSDVLLSAIEEGHPALEILFPASAQDVEPLAPDEIVAYFATKRQSPFSVRDWLRYFHPLAFFNDLWLLVRP